MSENKNPMFYNVRLGIQPINWCNDDMHDLGDEYSFEDIITEMQLAGFEGTELGRKYPRNPKILRDALKDRRLVLTSGWCDLLFLDDNLADKYFDRYKKHVDFLKEMGCKQVIVCEVGGSTCWDPREDRRKIGVKKMCEDEWKKLSEGLNKCGFYAKENGMELVYHVHNGTVIETAEETEKMCELTDGDKVFILADTGHLYMCGVDVPAFFKRFAKRIKYVHLKNVRDDILRIVKEFGMDFNSAARIGIFTVPGDGGMDYKPIMEILSQNGYQGWMIVEAEQNPKYANPLEYARKARKYLEEVTGI